MSLICLNYKFKSVFATDIRNRTNKVACPEYAECHQEVVCPPAYGCFSLWAPIKNGSSVETPKLLSAGCVSLPEDDPPFQNDCLANRTGVIRRGRNYFCSCSQSWCNERVNIFDVPLIDESTTIGTNEMELLEPPPQHSYVLASLLAGILLVFVAIALLIIFRRRQIRRKRRSTTAKRGNKQELSPQDVELAGLTRQQPPEGIQTTTIVEDHHQDLSLDELIGQGKYGKIFRAKQPDGQQIAVKITRKAQRDIYSNEVEIYRCNFMRGQENLLKFIFAETHSNECWLGLEYASNKSLQDYLRSHKLGWNEFVRISIGIITAMTHLHEHKIAHRDLKSSNVLLKHDLTPCVSDFGLAFIFDQQDDQEQSKLHLQVGTPRYMAPEVLEGSVAFEKSSFQKIDVYAMSLVLWELISRLRFPNLDRKDGVPVGLIENLVDDGSPYVMPYDNMGVKVTDIEQMGELVSFRKQRPEIKDAWRVFPTTEYSRSMEDGWEYDHDARISASCFLERLGEKLRSRVARPPDDNEQQHSVVA